VKHYSSGMYVRLGFSIAVHTEPEILLVDEVLAVGDAAFQQKCLEKVAEFRREGRTVLFISHNLQLVQQLCTRILWLESGEIRQAGQADRVVAGYVAAVEGELEAKLDLQNTDKITPAPCERLHICDVKVVDAEGRPRWTFRSGDPLRIHIVYESTEEVRRPVFSILIHRSDGTYISSTNTYNINPLEIGPIAGRGELVITIDQLDLYEGDYFLSVGAYLEPDPPYWSTPAHLLDKQYKFRMLSPNGAHGIIVLPARWEHRPGGKNTL